jgi:UDPglucose--hexose-1-phosphate uridylyltransferase
MSLIRYDVTTNDWVIFAPERIRRPYDVKKSTGPSIRPRSEELCPFCPGNEHLAGPEIFALRGNTAPNKPGWTVRVIPNKFPALRIEEDHHRQETGPLHRFMGGCGAHEVIIESPEHGSSFDRQPVEQVEFVLRTLQLRFNDLMRDSRFQAIVIFKNHGEGAGTSLRHPHWQLIATPVVPRTLRLKHAVATDYFDQTGKCLYCDILEEELAVRERLVVENEHYAVITPYASRVAFETWVLPKVHHCSFGWVDAASLRPLAAVLKTVLGKLNQTLDNPDYNLTINTAPRGDEDKRYFLWHIEILPRLTHPAGFELGSGMAINTVLPEDVASYLRDAKIA